MIERLRRPGQHSLRSNENEDVVALVNDLEDKIVQLYYKIYEYQIRLMCQYSHVWAVRFGRDVIKADDWDKMLTEIHTLDSDCSRISNELGQEELERSLDESNRQIDGLVQSWYDGIETLQKDIDKVSTSMEAHIQEQQAWRLEEKARECLQTLRTKNIYEDQKNRTKKRFPGTCGWFLNNVKFQEWKDNKGSGLLWVSANPGCGKSVLVRSLVDEGLLTLNRPDTTVCYFFFKDISSESRSICKAIAAILHQLFSKKPLLVDHATSAYALNGSELPNIFSTMWEILIEAAKDHKAGDIVCVLDAIDECEEAQQIALIDTLKTFYDKQKNPLADHTKLRFLITSRPYREIGIRFHALVRQFPTIHLSGDEESDLIGEEIEHVARLQVETIASERSLDENAKQILLEQLLKVENRTYLWLDLVLDQIRYSDQADTAKEIQKEFLRIPRSVSSAYETILSKAKDRDMVLRLLYIIVGAESPMTVRDLNVALCIEDTLVSYETLDLEEIDMFALRIRNLCGLFINIDRSYVYLIHQTAKDFLIRLPDDPEPPIGTWQHSLRTDKAQMILANKCIKFLMLANFEKETSGWSESTTYEEILQFLGRYDFLGYACSHWTTHLFRCGTDLQTTRLEWIASLLEFPLPRFQTWSRIIGVLHETDSVGLSMTTGLILASRYGFMPLVEHFLSKGTDVNGEDGQGATALNLAVAQGKVDVARLLLRKGADIEASNWMATWRSEIDDTGSERDVRPFSGRPLSIAVVNNNHELIRLLVEYGADMEVKDWVFDCTALHLAVTLGADGKDGYEEEEKTIRMLLDFGANVNARSEGSKVAPQSRALTVLQTALVMDKTSFAKTLLIYKADLNAELFIDFDNFDNWRPDDPKVEDYESTSTDINLEYGEDALNHSIEAFVRDLRLNLRRMSRMTVMHLAVCMGNADMVACLLSFASTDSETCASVSPRPPPSAPSGIPSNEPTLLHLAAILGYHDIASQLLRAGAADINAVDSDGHTALLKSCIYNWNDVRDMLITEGARVPPSFNLEGHEDENENKSGEEWEDEGEEEAERARRIRTSPRSIGKISKKAGKRAGHNREDTAGESAGRKAKPVYMRVDRKHLSTTTLKQYGLPWMWDERVSFSCPFEFDVRYNRQYTDQHVKRPNYVIIKRWIPELNQELIFDHTRRLRETRFRQSREMQRFPFERMFF